jgi:uncharacterized protein YggE
LKHRPLIAALCAACLASAPMAAPLTEPLSVPVQRQISVTGEGQVDVAPDMATITLGVTNQAKEAGDAMAATSAAVAQMLTRLDDLGIAARDRQTRSLSLNPIWSNRASSVSGPAKITGFVASNAVLVRVRDLDNLGRIMDAVIAGGANDFNGLQFSVQKPDPLMDDARKLAVTDAIAKARLLATAAGVTLGPVLTMSEQGGGRPVQMDMAAARSGGTPIAAGEVSVHASVSMVFGIAD